MKHVDIPMGSLQSIKEIRRETLHAIKTLKGWSSDPQNGPPIDGFNQADADDFIAILDKYASVLRLVAQSDAKGLRSRLKHATYVLLDRPEARVCALLRAFVRRKQHASANSIKTLAEQLSVWHPLTEKVRVRWVKKQKPGYRPIMSFGPMRTAQCLIVRDMLSLMGIDSDLDFSRKGGGERALLKKVCDLYTDGYVWWWTPDIKRCFGSIKPGHFRSLPIDRRLLKNVIFLPKCAKIEVVNGGTPVLGLPVGLSATSTTQIVRRGLPQGSVLSPLLARAVVGRTLRLGLSKMTAEAFSFSDDLTIGAGTKFAIKAAQQSVTSAFLSLPAGPIELHDSRPYAMKSGKGMVMGYRPVPGRGYGNNPVHVKPGPPRIARFKERLARRLTEAGPNADLLQVAEEYWRSWFNSQQAWTKVPFHSKQLSRVITFTYVVDFEHHLPMG